MFLEYKGQPAYSSAVLAHPLGGKLPRCFHWMASPERGEVTAACVVDAAALVLASENRCGTGPADISPTRQQRAHTINILSFACFSFCPGGGEEPHGFQHLTPPLRIAGADGHHPELSFLI